MSEVLIVYITTPDRKTADLLSENLVQERLAACTNLLPGMESRYRWQGKIQTAQEFVLIAKTEKHLFEHLRQRVADLHPYEVPCVMAWPVTHGHPPYLNWLKESVTPEGK